MSVRFHRIPATTALAFFLIGGPGLSFGQDIERAKTLREQLLGELKLGAIVDPESPGETAEPGSDPARQVELLPSLNGIVLVPAIDRVSAEPIQLAEEKVVDRDVDAPDGVVAALEPFLKKPVTLDLLDELTRTITSAYEAGDRPVVDAFLPEQNVTSGVVQIVVVEGRVGEVRVEGASHSKPEYLRRQVRVETGDPIRRRALQHDLYWLNAQPLRTVNLVFEKGETYGETDLVLQVADSKPFHANAGIGNTGLDLTGETEWNFGASMGRLFGTEQLLAYQYSADLEFESLEAHSAYWWAPLPWRHHVEVIGAYVLSEADLAVDDIVIGVGGESSLFAFDYVIPAERRPLKAKRFDWRFGFDYKSTNNNLEFGGAQVFDETAEVIQFRAGLETEWVDRFGAAGLGANLVWSPGDLSSSNDDASFSSQRGGASSDYAYAELTLERLFELPNDWKLALTGEGQLSNSRLISTEQLLAGGYRTVRGFDENLARGDSGLLGSVELLAPPTTLFGRGELQPLAFYDIGWLTNVDAAGGEPDQTLSSLGLEFKHRLGKLARLRAGYGWVLSSGGVQALDEDGKFHFGATVLY